MDIVISGIKYETFCLEKVIYGGMSKDDAIALLRSKGVNARKGGYSEFVNLYPILVQKSQSRKASRILWGV